MSGKHEAFNDANYLIVPSILDCLSLAPPLGDPSGQSVTQPRHLLFTHNAIQFLSRRPYKCVESYGLLGVICQWLLSHLFHLFT